MGHRCGASDAHVLFFAARSGWLLHIPLYTHDASLSCYGALPNTLNILSATKSSWQPYTPVYVREESFSPAVECGWNASSIQILLFAVNLDDGLYRHTTGSNVFRWGWSAGRCFGYSPLQGESGSCPLLGSEIWLPFLLAK